MADRHGISPINRNAGLLQLRTGSQRTRRSVRRALSSIGAKPKEASGELRVELGAGELASVTDVLARSLSKLEVEDTRAGFEPDAAGVEGIAEAPLRRFLGEVEGRWLWELIEKNRLTCHFQPIVTVQGTTRPTAYECLLRAHDLDESQIPPLRLLRAARAARILPILDTAAHLTAIQDATAYGIRQPIFINVSPVSIVDPLYAVGPVIAAARRSGLPADHFVFEVTESDTLEDFTPFLSMSRRFRRLGVRVALDDLGAGYSSLNLLPKLEPDFIKIDMQLIRDIEKDAAKAAIVNKLVEMARELGVPTIAEGVETEGEWACIRDLGVDYAQGYYMARPAAPPPLLERAAEVPAYRPQFRPLLDLYLGDARRRLSQLTATILGEDGGRPPGSGSPMGEFGEAARPVRPRTVETEARAASETVVFLASTGEIQFHTSAAETLGYPEGALIAKDVFGLVHPNDLAALTAAFDRSLLDPSAPIQASARFRHSRGDWVPLTLRGYTKLWEGAVGGFVVWLSDGAG